MDWASCFPCCGGRKLARWFSGIAVAWPPFWHDLSARHPCGAQVTGSTGLSTVSLCRPLTFRGICCYGVCTVLARPADLQGCWCVLRRSHAPARCAWICLMYRLRKKQGQGFTRHLKFKFTWHEICTLGGTRRITLVRLWRSERDPCKACFAASSAATGQKNSAADRPGPADPRPQAAMPRALQ